MSRVHRFLCLGAVGLIAAAVPISAASAATPPAARPGGLGGFPIGITTPIGSVGLNPDPGGNLSCMPFEYSLGPFGPLGPWGPAGPLHNDKHPDCFGGGPSFK
jgi:hypothetical protein